MDEFLLPEEAAEQLRVNTETVMRWLRDGKMRGAKLPGRGMWRIPKTEIDRILGTLEVGGE